MSHDSSILLPDDSEMQVDDTVMMEYGQDDTQVLGTGGQAAAALPAQRLGLLEVIDKSGATVNRLTVTHWPVTVGRALTADLVVDDVHMAPEHLRISALDAGFVVVQVLETVNGVRRGYGALMQRGMRFDWSGSDELVLGRLRLRLRLPGTPLAPEELLPTFPWKWIGVTVALVMAMVCATLVDAWFKTTYSAKFAQVAIPAIAILVGGVALWAGVWALATKLFTGHLQFLRHVRIVCAVLLMDQLVSLVAYVLAFVFSWESLARYNGLLSMPIVGAGIFLQLMVIAPRRRKGLMALVAGTVLLALLSTVAVNWQRNKRVSNQLYMSALFPPGWRLAPAVPVGTLVQEAKSIEQRLGERMKDLTDQQGDAPDLQAEEE